MRTGLAEGRALGLQKGYEIGEPWVQQQAPQPCMHANIVFHSSYIESESVAADWLVGMEVGHYAGCVRMWRALQQQQPGSIPTKLERSIAAMEECLLQYPLYKPQVGHSTGRVAWN